MWNGCFKNILSGIYWDWRSFSKRDIDRRSCINWLDDSEEEYNIYFVFHRFSLGLRAGGCAGHFKIFTWISKYIFNFILSINPWKYEWICHNNKAINHILYPYSGRNCQVRLRLHLLYPVLICIYCIYCSMSLQEVGAGSGWDWDQVPSSPCEEAQGGGHALHCFICLLIPGSEKCAHK